MDYLKTYESFSIGRNAYIITDESGEFIFNDSDSLSEPKTHGDRELFGLNLNFIPTALHNSKIEYDDLLEKYVYWDLKEANESLGYLHREESEIILINSDDYNLNDPKSLEGEFVNHKVSRNYDPKKMKVVKIFLGAVSDQEINLG